MFVPPKSPADELWDGPRTGVDGAKELFAADEVYSLVLFITQLQNNSPLIDLGL